MIKALNIATQGLLQSESRATDLAAEILKKTSEASSFSLDDDAGQSQNTAALTSPSTSPSGPGYSDLLQNMVDLKAEGHAFKANATVFKRLDEAYDEALGSFFDEDS
ncbi:MULTISPECIES: hypothetical protein [Kordiimonas]|jgi:hypothetical protein|uniref:Uncharacterized protein n=1 Tax=Kordiimonas lacus TaxID=637679 RepID=A0A1G6VJN0_9PROT|nr:MULTISPECIES: hypothetical protein [Kordiimonas]SDD53257.1 hypothetical protein SAMN04488071_0735 [Kordiimonas lacus]